MQTFEIVKVFDRMDFIFWGSNPGTIYTGHRNFLYVVTPSAPRPNAQQYVFSEAHR